MTHILKYKFISHILLALLTTLLFLTGCSSEDEDGRTLFESGIENMKKGNLPVAYRLFNSAIAAFEEEQDSIGAFEAKVHLSLLCSTIGQKEQGYALIESTPFFHIKREGNYSSQYYWRLKAYYAGTLDKDYHLAGYCLRKLLEIDSLDFSNTKGYLYMDKANLAEMYLEIGQPQKAWKIIKEIEANPVKPDNHMSQTYYTHALLLLKEGKLDSACMYAERSIAYSKKCNALENEANAMSILMKRDSVRGNLVSYIKWRNTHDSLINHIRGNEITHHITVIQEQHKFDLQKKDVQRKHIERSVWMWGFSICIVALAVITSLLYKQNKLRLKSETNERIRLGKEVEYKKLENELLALKMQQAKEELEKQHNNNTDAIRQLAAADDRKSIPTRLKMLEATLNTNHAEFIQYMEKTYPQLTHNDILILGFMRMNITVLEMASALGISPDSLHKARYRLRKKLKIESMEELNNLVKQWTKPNDSQVSI